MGFFDYTQARKTYRNDKTMLQVIDALEDMDQYHLLRRSSINKASFELPDTAVEIKPGLQFVMVVCCSPLPYLAVMIMTRS